MMHCARCDGGGDDDDDDDGDDGDDDDALCSLAERRDRPVVPPLTQVPVLVVLTTCAQQPCTICRRCSNCEKTTRYAVP